MCCGALAFRPSSESAPVPLTRFLCAGPAEASNQIQAGDCLIKIDGRDVVGKRTGFHPHFECTNALLMTSHCANA